MPEKTICEIEFEKWWDTISEYEKACKWASISAWNQAWAICGKKIVEAVKNT